jgi:hypothetical protein
MKTSDEIRKEIEILEAEAAGLRAKIYEHEKDMKACRERLHEVVGYGRRGLIENCKRELELANLSEVETKLPAVRVLDGIGSTRTLRFVKKTKKLIFLQRICHWKNEFRQERFNLDGSISIKWSGQCIHPDDLAKILDGTI